MNRFISILFWVGIIFLVDGSLALMFHEKWAKRIRPLNILRIAWIEIGLGLLFLSAHYILSQGL